MGFYYILFSNGSRAGPLAGLWQVVSPQLRQDGLSRAGGWGQLSLPAPSFGRRPLTLAFFMLCITRTWFIPRKEARQKHAIKMLRWPLQREALGLCQADASN